MWFSKRHTLRIRNIFKRLGNSYIHENWLVLQAGYQGPLNWNWIYIYGSLTVQSVWKKFSAADNDKNNKYKTESETRGTPRGRQKIWTLTLYEDLCVLVEFFSPSPTTPSPAFLPPGHSFSRSASRHPEFRVANSFWSKCEQHFYICCPATPVSGTGLLG